MTDLTLVRVGDANLAVLDRLMQFYLYDFSEVLCGEPEARLREDGRFEPGLDIKRYAAGEARGVRYEGWLARAGGQWAGFALISDRVDAAHHAGPGHNVDEFFVMRCFRRQGIGAALARRVFDAYPGYWQITQLGPNRGAVAFWQRTVEAYTGGRFRSFETQEHGMPLHWQTFDSGEWQPGRNPTGAGA